jgi:hypothetical protein
VEAVAKSASWQVLAIVVLVEPLRSQLAVQLVLQVLVETCFSLPVLATTAATCTCIAVQAPQGMAATCACAPGTTALLQWVAASQFLLVIVLVLLAQKLPAVPWRSAVVAAAR